MACRAAASALAPGHENEVHEKVHGVGAMRQLSRDNLNLNPNHAERHRSRVGDGANSAHCPG